MLMLGLGTAGFGAMQATIILLVARDDMRGRGLGVITLAIGAGPIGASDAWLDGGRDRRA